MVKVSAVAVVSFWLAVLVLLQTTLLFPPWLTTHRRAKALLEPRISLLQLLARLRRHRRPSARDRRFSKACPVAVSLAARLRTQAAAAQTLIPRPMIKTAAAVQVAMVAM